MKKNLSLLKTVLTCLLFILIMPRQVYSLCNPQPTIYISGYVTWTTSTSVFSDVIITPGSTLEINGATINMMASTQIRVQNAGRLMVISSTLSNACTNMWRGIFNENGGSVIMNDAVIENAEFALELERLTDTQIENTTFDKNYIGIYTKPQSSQINFLSFYLDNVTFDCTGSLIPNSMTSASKTYAGIFFNTTDAVIEGAISKLNFLSLNMGICAISSNIYVRSSYFEKIQPDATYGNIYDGSAIYSDASTGNYLLDVTGLAYDYSIVTMQTCRFGVYALAPNTFVRFCTMQLMDVGVKVINCKDVDVWIGDNFIYAYKYGINLLYNDYVKTMNIRHNGIFINYSGMGSGGIGINITDNGNAPTRNKWIIDNHMLSDYCYGGILMTSIRYSYTTQNDITLNTSYPTFGWLVEKGGKNELECNSVTKFGSSESNERALFWFANTADPISRCNTAYGGEIGFRFDGNCGVVNLEKNTFRDNVNAGLYLESTASISLQANKSNQWYNSSSSTYANCNGCLPANSLFKVYPAAPYYPTIVNPTTGWFSPNLTPEDPSCTNNPCQESIIEFEHRFSEAEMHLINNGELGLTEFESEMQETMKQTILYEISKMNYSEITQPMADFYSTYNEGDLNKFLQMNAFFNSRTISEVNQTSLFENSEEVKSKLLQNHELNKYKVENTISIGEEDSINTIINANNSVIETLESDNSVISESLQYNDSLIFSEARNINDGISSSQIMYKNQKKVDQIYLDLITENFNSLTSLEVIQLENIANQCPVIGGSAVLQARGMLGLTDSIYQFNDQEACHPTSSQRKHHIKEADFKIYPNPTSDKITININSKKNENYTFRLYNMLGVEVVSLLITGNQINRDIDVTGLANGIYNYSLISGNSEIKGYIIRN